MKINRIKKGGFTLVEVMITVTVLGVIAALAIPAYQDYVTRSQVAESIALFDGKRVGAEDFLHLNGFENSKTFSNIGPLRSEYIEMGMEAYDSNYYDIAFLYGANSNKNLQGRSILFYNEISEKDNILWECETNIEQKYLPNNLKCFHLNIPPETGPNPGGGNPDNKYCSPVNPPSHEDMPPVSGYEITYIPSNNGYAYSKVLDEGKFIYYYDYANYVDKNGLTIDYDKDTHKITEVSLDGQFYLEEDGSFTLYYPDYYKISNDIKDYKRALVYQKTYENKPVPSWIQNAYDRAIAGLADGSLKENANKFFTQFEKDYVKNGEISPTAPKILEDIYKNVDRDSMEFNQPSMLLNPNSYPELINNINLLDDSLNFGIYRCGDLG